MKPKIAFICCQATLYTAHRKAEFIYSILALKKQLIKTLLTPFGRKDRKEISNVSYPHRIYLG